MMNVQFPEKSSNVCFPPMNVIKFKPYVYLTIF